MNQELVNNLINILQKEYDYYQTLCDLACAKKEALINNNVEELAQLVEKDTEKIELVQQLEEKRNNILANFSQELGLEKEVKLNNLLKEIPKPYQNKLKNIRKKLLKVIEEFQQINEENRVLLEEAIELNSFSFKMMANIVEPDSQTYDNTNNNNNKESGNKVRHIMDRKV